jgi:hypothetical protein
VRHAREFNDRLGHMHLNPVRKGLMSKPDEWRWSSYSNFTLNKALLADCPIQIDYVTLSEQYRA